jgi:nucleoside-triphosphatase
MKILLTGAPGTGKTTIVAKIAAATQGAFWVVSERTFDGAGAKSGFQARTSTGLSGVWDTRTDGPAGSLDNHTTDIAAVDRLFTEPINRAVDQGVGIIIIDEIGALERRSPDFIKAVDRALASDATILATIKQGEDWTATYTGRSDIITLTLTAENRDELTGALSAILASTRMYQSLPPLQQSKVYALARSYAAAGQISSLRKLFQNTLIYLAESRYESVSTGLYNVRGLTRQHQVSLKDGVWTCDCDLANGRGKFDGHPAECSHVQTLKITQA